VRSDEPPHALAARVRAGTLRRGLLVLSCGLLAGTVAACQSTEQESARIARQSGHADAAPAALRLGARSRTVRASSVTLVRGEGRLAVAARLTNSSHRSERAVPILLTVVGRGARPLYSNATGGLEDSLQRVALLRAHQSAWWVDDQVLTSQPATTARVRIGAGKPAHGVLPAPTVRSVHVGSQAGIATVAGRLVNRSPRPAGKLPVFAVALRGGHVVAAGRAVVGALAAGVGASAPFQIVLVGSPAGAKIELTAMPGSG
jgi:hypothetical protein